MRNRFPGHFRPTESEFNRLWEECCIVLDTNVLLNLYRYTPETSEELLGILNNFSERIWIPHQAAKEYLNNRPEVIRSLIKAYDEIDSILDNTQQKLEGNLSSYSKHPYVNVSKILMTTKKLVKSIRSDLNKQKISHPDLLGSDDIRTKLVLLFENNIGEQYNSDRLEEIYSEGIIRYEKEIPPGYKDVEKASRNRRFADLIIWHQIIDKANSIRKPIVLVTDDTKEDWWWKLSDGRIISPRPELIEEFSLLTGVSFYMYQSDQFMKHAKRYLKQQLDQSAVKEIQEVRELRSKLEDSDSLYQEKQNLLSIKSRLIFDLEINDKQLKDAHDRISDLLNTRDRFGHIDNLTKEEQKIYHMTINSLQKAESQLMFLQRKRDDLISEMDITDFRLRRLEDQLTDREYDLSSTHPRYVNRRNRYLNPKRQSSTENNSG